MNLIQKHKLLTEQIRQKLGLSDYATMWLAFVKGVLLGCLVTYCLSG